MAIIIDKQQNSLKLLALTYSFILASLSFKENCYAKLKKIYSTGKKLDSFANHQTRVIPDDRQDTDWQVNTETRLMQNDISTVAVLLYSNLDLVASDISEPETKLQQPQTPAVVLSYEEQLVTTFVNHLAEPNLLLQELFRSTAVSKLPRIMMVASSVAIPEYYQQQLKKIINKQVGINVQLKFLSRADFLPGIQLWDLDYSIYCSLERFVIELSN